MSRGDVARWWNVDYLAPMSDRLVSTTSLLEWKARLTGRRGQAHCWVLRDRARAPPWTVPSFERPLAVTPRCDSRGVRDRHPGWYRPYLENCIVDASIFVAILLYVNDKLLRAHGGCLGIKSR
jgi:hypothetical protein